MERLAKKDKVINYPFFILKKELEPLQKIIDHYSKFILTLDEDLKADYEA